jgi:C4-dicarboxylate-specific signal transduction histidine kinase
VKLTGSLQPFEKEYFHKDGRRVPALVGVARIEETRDQAVAFVIDLTEQKQAETALREAERQNRDAQMQLAHANRIATMGQLAASIAHEVNQPIGGTLVNAGTALRWLTASAPKLESVRQCLDRIVNDSKRGGVIIHRIRDLAKNTPARKESLEIDEVVLGVIELTSSEISNRRVSVQKRLTDDLPPILGDKVHLQQVILNLIMNAVEAMGEISEESRELLISSGRTEAGGVLVEISDSGPGLPSGNSERIFEAFYTTKASGLGMGLSICRSIVEAHGDRLWAMPNEPRGTVFCMALPVGEQSFE